MRGRLDVPALAAAPPEPNEDNTVWDVELRTDVERSAKSTTWTYRTRHPMATELAQVSIGRSAVLHQEGPDGLPVRDVVPAKDVKALKPWLEKTPGQLAWMQEKARGLSITHNGHQFLRHATKILATVSDALILEGAPA